jgi:hypothetical protein
MRGPLDGTEDMRQPNRGRDASYERDRAFVFAVEEFFVTRGGLPDNWMDLLQQGLANVESLGKGAAKRGLRMALQDTIEHTRDLTPDELKALEEHLAAAGVLPLATVRRRILASIPRILKRGRIRSEEEYYLLMERLNDVDDPELTDANREVVGAMIAAFEQQFRE